MKIAVATMNGGLEDSVSPVFGRCMKYTIVECEGNEIKDVVIVDNPGFNSQGGAGITAAQFIAGENVEYAVSGNFGPKASVVLSASKIKMMQVQGSVNEVVGEILKGSLTPVDGSTVSEHFGMGGFGKGRGRGRR